MGKLGLPPYANMGKGKWLKHVLELFLFAKTAGVKAPSGWDAAPIVNNGIAILRWW